MRQWLWPYALLAITLTVLALFFLTTMVIGAGIDRAGAQLVAANAVVIEPAKGILISMLDMVAPFSIPGWLKQLYANLVLIALVGLVFATVAGLFLLPVFYALYRSSERGRS